MKKKKKAIYILAKVILLLSIFELIFSVFLLFKGLFINSFLLSIVLEALGCFLIIIGIRNIKILYIDLLIDNRKSKRWCPPLTTKELEIVEDAKELIESVDDKIVIADFNVYKIRFLTEPWFWYDKETNELNIFIPFDYYFNSGNKDLCFSSLVHEILHSQNLKNNLVIFTTDFLEGLNELLTNWLIDTYSKKYIVPEMKYYVTYQKQVKSVLQKSNVNNLKQVFLNYINFEPEFFKSFVPLEYFIENCNDDNKG